MAARDIILVDLSGTPDNRRVMRSFSRFLVSTDTFLRRVKGDSGPRVLVFAPAADGKSVDWPDRAEMVFTDELLDIAASERINDWVDQLSWPLVEDEDLWPTLDGIGLGRLNMFQVQDSLLKYAQATESLRRLIDRDPCGDCIVVSGYPEIARAIRADVADRQVRVRVRALPKYRPGFLHRNGAPALEPALELLADLRPRTLIVSESRPMAGLFGAVEACKGDAEVGSSLRLQYDGQRGLERDGDTAILHLTRPELQSGTARFPVDSRAIRRRLAALSALPGPYRPPLKLLYESLTRHVLPRQARHLAEVRRILEATRPELIIVGNDRWWVGMAFVLIARQMGIQTLAVQDGVAWDTPMWTCATADHIAVNGTQLQSFLLKRKFSPERITLVGQPRYDSFNAAAGAAVRDDERARIGLPSDRFAVMFATQPNQDDSYVRRVAHAILAVPEVHLLLRPHPSTPAKALAELERIARGERVTSVRDGAILNLIAASDLIVVQNSTVALEAALLDRPVVTANLTGLPDVVPYAEIGVAVEAKDAAGVTALVRRALAGELPTAATSERARAGIHYLVGPTDGRAAERVARLIGSLLRRHAHR